MKQILFTLVAALFSVASLCAQQIAVVNGSGSTSVYDTLDEAIEGATSGCTIYLPGGGFQVNEKTKITKKITIIGISHKANSDDVDGNTVVSGDLNFAPGSDGSAAMGIYLSGNVNIGSGGRVKNITIKYCNANSIQVHTDSCPGILINQNYLRNPSNFGGSSVIFSNNITHYVIGIRGGQMNYNTFVGYYYAGGYGSKYTADVSNTTTMYNICKLYGFYGAEDTGTEVVNFDYFVSDQGINTRSDYHFKSEYNGNRNIGVYGGGTGFNDGGLPPMPHIISKSVAEQTDAQGKLKIRVTVKAN